MPEPLNSLSQHAVGMHAWPLQDRGRWLALTIGQADKEPPRELLAAVGLAAALDLSAVSRS
ncbi:hypothetical protein [Streptomyces mirabilis]|uniref:hypothetical protein n=1 Tax=Streptomyces mirabilis TaxID=68239 RepID=UPI0036928801